MDGKNGQLTASPKIMDIRNGQGRWTAPNGRKEWTPWTHISSFQNIATKFGRINT